jgi:pyroglutamyl-peptidase
LRRPALADVILKGHIFRVSYGAVQRDLLVLLADHAPDAVLMFGLAQRTPYLRVETRARNVVTGLWPDVDQTTPAGRMIARNTASSARFGPHTGLLLQAARAAGVWTELSQDAGRYLCNYLSWKVLTAADENSGRPPAAFVHVPLVPRPTITHRPLPPHGIGFEDLVDAGEALLMTMVKLARQRSLVMAPG